MNEKILKENLIINRGFRSDCDLFGHNNVTDLHWGKIFIHMFQEYFSTYEINQQVDTNAFITEMCEIYSVHPEQIIRNDKTLRNDPKNLNYNRSEILLILKEGLFVSVCENNVTIMYSSKIKFRDLEDIIDVTTKFKNEKKKRQT